MRLRLVSFTLLLTVNAALLGCSDGNPAVPVGVTVKGKVLKGGQPLTAQGLPPGEVAAEVVFVPEAGGESERQALQPDGTFIEPGPAKGMAAGKYKLAVFHYVKGRGSDGLNGAFAEAKTPIHVEIPADKKGGTYDMGTIELSDYSK